MDIKSRILVVNRKGSLIKISTLFWRTCSINPKIRIRLLPPPKVIALTVISILAIVGLAALIIQSTISNPAWNMFFFKNMEVIDSDRVLPSRVDPNPSRASAGSPFYVANWETLIIRDCTLYTSSVYAPPQLKLPYGQEARQIWIRDYANLTMINVKVIPYVIIFALDHASVTMINVTNYSSSWDSGSNEKDPGLHRRLWAGNVEARYNATILVVNSSIGTVGDPYYRGTKGEITLVKTWVASQEMKPAAVRLNATINKKEFKWGEPIPVTFRIDNIGEATLNFNNGTDYFRIVPYEYPEKNQTIIFYVYEATSSEFWFPSKLEPGKAFVKTVTLLGDGSTPFQIWRQEAPNVINRTTNMWWNSSLNPGKYAISAGTNSRTLDFRFQCGWWVIPISEEKWLG